MPALLGGVPDPIADMGSLHSTDSVSSVIVKDEKVNTASILIGSRAVGPREPVFIIAEAGVNHNGDLELAKALIREAKQCGADCVKFQTFKTERVVIPAAPKADYQMRTTAPTESQAEMIRKLELDPDAYPVLLDICARERILFLSTPANIEDVDFLNDLAVPAFKLASFQIVEPAFLRYVAEIGKPIILSTGMATLAEVEEAVSLIRDAGNNQVILLQCTTNYPSRPQDANLRAMQTMQAALDTLVGYSDHTKTETACVAAVALGACVIEKHFTLDKTMPGPDQSSSADPDEFMRLVKLIRETEMVLGSAVKAPVEAERRNAVSMRRSIVSKVTIPAGTLISEDMLCYKRPGSGIPPAMLNNVVGCVAVQNIPADTLVLDEWLRKVKK